MHRRSTCRPVWATPCRRQTQFPPCPKRTAWPSSPGTGTPRKGADGAWAPVELSCALKFVQITCAEILSFSTARTETGSSPQVLPFLKLLSLPEPRWATTRQPFRYSGTRLIRLQLRPALLQHIAFDQACSGVCIDNSFTTSSPRLRKSALSRTRLALRRPFSIFRHQIPFLNLHFKNSSLPKPPVSFHKGWNNRLKCLSMFLHYTIFAILALVIPICTQANVLLECNSWTKWYFWHKLTYLLLAQTYLLKLSFLMMLFNFPCPIPKHTIKICIITFAST